MTKAEQWMIKEGLGIINEAAIFLKESYLCEMAEREDSEKKDRLALDLGRVGAFLTHMTGGAE